MEPEVVLVASGAACSPLFARDLTSSPPPPPLRMWSLLEMQGRTAAPRLSPRRGGHKRQQTSSSAWMSRDMDTDNSHDTIKDLACYVPGILARYLQDDSRGSQLSPPECQTLDAVCMFADVSGFTKLGEKLQTRAGEFAPQLLAKYLNSYIEQLVRHYAKAGGDVVKFAGDAQIVLWPATDDMLSTVRRVLQCALDVQNHQKDAKVGPVDDSVELNIKIGVGAGQVSVLHIGGVEDGTTKRMEYVATGPPLIGGVRLRVPLLPAVRGMHQQRVRNDRGWGDTKGLFFA